MTFAKIEEAVTAIARGEMIVVVDDHDRENEGDILFASEHATPEKIAFMMNHARGLICVPMTGERLDALDLPPMFALELSTALRRQAEVMQRECAARVAMGETP